MPTVSGFVDLLFGVLTAEAPWHDSSCCREEKYVQAKFQGYHESELLHYFNQFLFYYHLREAFGHVIAALAGVRKRPGGFA